MCKVELRAEEKRIAVDKFEDLIAWQKASCAEVRSQLYVALDIGYLNQNELQESMKLAKEVSRVIGGLRVSVDKRR